ncbi:hypothetical protein DMB92_00260 [Campylobacter sp. MIT 99-7217]|nr:hypothetical protein DMB92_00260 [Campylobacter sp. MIT 99-7217]
MKEVKGGYVVGFKALSNDEILAYAIPNWENELGLYTEDGVKYYYNRQGLLLNGGMCGLGITKCRLSDKENNQKHYYENRKRLIEVMSILGGNTDPYTHYLGYSVKRNIGTTSRGERFIYFSYGVAVINNSGNWYRVHSSNVLNHYKLIKEIRDAYRADMESILNRFR